MQKQTRESSDVTVPTESGPIRVSANGILGRDGSVESETIYLSWRSMGAQASLALTRAELADLLHAAASVETRWWRRPRKGVPSLIALEGGGGSMKHREETR